MDHLEGTIKTEIATQLVSIIGKHDGLTIDDFSSMIRKPKDPKVADYQLNVRALHKFRAVKKGEEEALGDRLVQEFKCDEKVVSVSANQGFVSFRVDQLLIAKTVLNAVMDQGGDYGNHVLNQEATEPVLIEFSSPNIAKPFHMGHLRSTIIGNFLVRLHRKMGVKVVSINYLGDWGKQYGLLAIGYRRYGQEEDLATDPMKHLYEVYVKINQDLETEKKAGKDDLDQEAKAYFAKMEENNPEALEFWTHLREISIQKYQETYNRLGVEFDVYSGESQAMENVPQIMGKLEAKHLMTKDEKGSYVDLQNYKLGHALMLKSDGATLYLTRDLAEVMRRYSRWNFSRCLYVVGKPQAHHFKQFFKLMELMDLPTADRCQHVEFGKVNGMSTRAGTAVFLTDILDEARDRMLEVMEENAEKLKEVENPEETADQLGISAVVVQDLGAKRAIDYDFDWKRITSFQGHTGPYLQYAHARISSIIRKVQNQISVEELTSGKVKIELLTEVEAHCLIKLIGEYPAILRKCLEVLEPSTLIDYLMEVAGGVAMAHQTLRVKDQEKELAKSRLAVFWSARVVLASGLKLLGLVPIEAM